MEALLALPVPVLFVVTTVACLIAGVTKKEYSERYSNTQSGFFLFNAGYGAVCALALFALSGFTLSASAFTIWAGAVFGVVTMTSTLCYLRALTLGPWGYTTVIYSLSTIIPAFSGALFWNEKLSVLQWIGIVLMCVSIILSVERKNDGKKGGAKWLFFSLLSSVAMGLIGVLQKVHQSSAYKEELNAFLVIAFAALAVVAGVATLAVKSKRGQEIFSLAKQRTGWQWKTVVLLLFSGIGVALNNVINLYLSGVVDSAIFFPIVNGSELIFTTVLAFALYKERLTKTQVLGFSCGILAGILLCIA